MKSFKQIAESIKHLRENDVADKHVRDINLDILWSVVSGNSTRMGVAESLRGISKRYVLNMTITEFNEWMYNHRPLVEMFYDFATTADIQPVSSIIESLSESLLEGSEFLSKVHSLIIEGNYIGAYNEFKEASYDDLESTPDSLYYFLAVNEAFTIADLCKPSNSHLWESILETAERSVEDHPSLASLALASRWYMSEGGEWDDCSCKKDEELDEGSDSIFVVPVDKLSSSEKKKLMSMGGIETTRGRDRQKVIRVSFKNDKEREAFKKKHHKMFEGKDEEYEKFFKAALKKFGVSSPDELGDKKKEFFNYVDKNWTGEKK